jgi:riboflavin biosynthesis pyrimidine reductase
VVYVLYRYQNHHMRPETHAAQVRSDGMRALLPTYDANPDLAAVFAFPQQDWVRAVFVSSVDGAATLRGRAGGLGNKTDQRLFSLQRHLGDVVLVGAGTVRVEGYGPVERDAEWSHVREDRPPTPPIAVVSVDLGLNPAAPLFTDAPEHARTIVITCAAAPEERREAFGAVADVIVAGDQIVDLAAAIDLLAARGLRRVTCEGGPTLMAYLAASGRLDELCLTLSPLIVGGDAPRITDGPSVPDPAQMRLGTVLEEDGYLYLLYQVQE